MDRIPIIHIYGSLPPLPWQENDSERTLGYGKQDALPGLNLATVIDNLYVVHDERTNPQLDKARKLIQDADRIFFLGFGYARENLDALAIPSVFATRQTIYGTAVGVPNIDAIIAHLKSGLRDAQAFAEMKIEPDADCVKLLHRYF